MIPDLIAAGDAYPDYGMQEPAIRNWKEMPPNGGWAVEAYVGGFKRRFGGDPVKIASSLIEAYRVRSPEFSERTAWNFLNYTWTKRDPNRAVVIKKAQDPSTPEQTRYDFTALSLMWLKSFSTVFSAERWTKAIEHISHMADPASGLDTADADFYERLTKARIKSTPTNEAEVKAWLREIS